MLIQISDVSWNVSKYLIKDGKTITIKEGVRAATFTCTCGHVWEAIATSKNLSRGYFVEGLTSIIVECPGCKVRKGIPQSNYEHL